MNDLFRVGMNSLSNNKKKTRVKKPLRFKNRVKVLFYYEPKDYDKGARLYRQLQDRLDDDISEDGIEKYYCFLKPEIRKIPLRVEPKIKRNLDKTIKKWIKDYYDAMKSYENVFLLEENTFIEQIAKKFYRFPKGDKFDYVFEKFRLLREFIQRIRTSKSVQFCRQLTKHKRYDLVERVIEYIEKDSMFLDEIKPEDFDEVTGITIDLCGELVKYVDLPDDDETNQRWVTFFNFFVNPRAEYYNLIRIWEETYIQLLNVVVVQAVINCDLETLRKASVRKPLESIANHKSFQLNSIQRADLYFSKRASKCPYSCVGHRGHLLLLMLNLKKLTMVKRLLDEGISINSSACAGNAIKMVWEEIKPEKPKQKKLSIISDDSGSEHSGDEINVEEFLERREEKQYQIISENDDIDIVEYELSNALVDFETNSFDSDHIAAHIKNEMLEDSEEEEQEIEESDWKLRTTYRTVNALSVSLLGGQPALVKYILTLDANPFKDNSICYRTMTPKQFLDALNKSKKSGMSSSVLSVINKGEVKLVEKAKLIEKKRRKKGQRIHPWQLVHCLILVQIIINHADDMETLQNFLDLYMQYFRDNAPPKQHNYRTTLNRTLRHTQISELSEVSPESEHKSMRARTKSGRTKSGITVQTGWDSMRKSASRGSNMFGHMSRRARRSITTTVFKPIAQEARFDRDVNNGRLTMLQKGGKKKFKFENPSEEYYFRFFLAIDYILEEEQARSFPHVSYLRAPLALLNEQTILLDKVRMETIVKLFVIAIEQDRFGSRALLLDCIRNNQPLQCFFGILPKQLRPTVTEMRDLVRTTYYLKVLKVKEDGFNYRKKGKKLFLKLLVKLGKLNEIKLLESIILHNQIKLKKSAIYSYFKALSTTNPIAAEIVTVKYPEYFEAEEE